MAPLLDISGQRTVSRGAGLFLRFYSVAVILYHLAAAEFGAPEVMKFRPTHVAMYVSMIFIAFAFRKSDLRERVPWHDWLLAALAWVPVFYIYANYEYVVERYPYVTPLTTMDWVVALLAIGLVLEACRRAVGLTLVVLFSIFVIHSLFGPYFPGPLEQSAQDPMRLVDHLFMTTSGLYGSITGISATYVLMFVLLGAVLEKAGGGDLFMNSAIGVMGRTPGGPGKAAVLASGLFGSISGAAVANVYATGTFTIPLMIKTGFKKQFAAAVESVASASGQLVPPIMGSAAFLIADFTRTPYVDVATAAALPALLYLFAVWFMVHLETLKYGLPSMDAAMVRDARRQIPMDIHMAMVLVIVVVLLVYRFTPFYAAYIGILSAVGLSWLRALLGAATGVAVLRPRMWMGPQAIIDAFELGARRIAPIAAALFMAGLIVGVIELSGLGLRFTSILLSVTGGSLFLTMLLVMVSCIILGMGLPTSAAYMIVAIFGAPALIKLGVQPLSAHFFVFYYAIVSAITPPVAVAAYAAATIAGTPMQQTGFSAMRLGAAVYLVPFVIVYNPALLLDGATWQIILAAITGLVGVVSLGACVQGFLLTRLGLAERTLAGLSAVSLLHGGWRTDFAGAALLAVLLGWQVLRRRAEQPAQ